VKSIRLRKRRLRDIRRERGRGGPPAPLIRDGEMLAVVRPEDPERAMATVRQIMEDEQSGRVAPEESERRFNGMLSEQPYTFVGIAGNNGSLFVLDESGEAKPIEGAQMQPGDSMVPLSSLQKVAKA
jgi:hypothetical protein